MKVGRGAAEKSEVQGIGRGKADKKREEERKELPQIMASLLL